MVRRLAQAEVKRIVLDVGAKVAEEISYWTSANAEYLGTAWQSMCALDSNRAYALFANGEPVGLFLGLIVPDLNSGRLQGLEFLWVAQRKHRGRAVSLLRRFEADCREKGCEIVLAGSIESMAGRMAELYDRLGYKPHARVFSKRLSHG